MSNFHFLDTKGTCLLCLEPKSVFKRSGNGETDSRTARALKMLLRYLKVDVTKLTHLSKSYPSVNKSMAAKNVDLLVTMCDECSSIANSFLELFQTFESIRLQLDMCVHQLQKVMDKGGKDERRVREYDKRMSTGARKDMINASMAEGLRNATMTKALSKTARSAPRISLRKIPNPKSSRLHVETDEDGKGRKSSRTRSITSFPGLEVLPSDMVLETEPNWNEEEVNEQLRMETESSELDEESMTLDVTDDVSYCHDDDDPLADDDLSEDDDDEAEKVALATEQLRPSESEVNVGLPHERYYDKLRKCFRWKCNLCGDTFSERPHLRTHKLAKHMMTVIKDQLPETVPESRVILALKRIIGRTPVISKNRYGSSKYECLFCKKTEWSMLKAHLLKYHLDKVIEEVEDCKDIIDAPKRKQYRKKHVSNSRILKFKCNQWGASLPSAFAVKQHKENPEIDDYLQCDYCGSHFMHPHNLRAHLIRNHPAAFFADKLPPGISDDGFNEAMKCILETAQDIGISHVEDPNSRDDCILECPYCGKRNNLSTAWTRMRVHIANFHLDEVIEEATREGLSVSCDLPNPQLKTESEAMNVEKGINPEDVKIGIGDGENERMDLVISDINPGDKKEESTSQNDPRSPVKKATPHIDYSDQRVGQFWKIQRKHKIAKSYKCDHCGMNFAQKPNLESHKYRKHTMIVLKDRLPPSISKEDVMKSLDIIISNSERNHQPGRQRSTYNCMFCNRKLYEYRIHLLQTHLAEVVQKAEENVGDPSFKTSRIVQLKKTKTCGICGEYFLSPHTLRVHKAEKHPEDSGKVEKQSFICHYCHKSCHNPHSLRAHLAVEHPVAYYADCMPAGVSDEVFKDVVTSMVDKMVEIGKKKGSFSCIHCDKGLHERCNFERRLHFVRVHLNKVIEEVKMRKESLVDSADESSDKPRTEDQVHEQSCEDMDCGNEPVPDSADDTVAGSYN